MQPKRTTAKLIEGPIGNTLTKMTIAMTLGMVGMVAFNLIDTFFVGKLGTDQLAALSFTFPVVLIVNSIALGLGFGASAVISRAIGVGDHHKVQRLTTDSLLLSIIIVIGFVTLGLLTIAPLFKAMGATSKIIPYIKTYMEIWYIGMPFVVVPMVGNNAIRATGDAKTPSIIMLIAVCVNTILDPLLIFGIGPFPQLGIQGAAIATVISRFTTFSVALWVLIKREKMISFDIPRITEIINSWKQVLFIGVPIAGSRIIIPITIGIITRIVSSYGIKAVAGFGVASRIEFFSLAVVRALASVFGPFIGQNLGARKFDRVHTAIRISYRFSILWEIAILILLVSFRNTLAGFFNDDPQVISTIALYLLIVPISYSMQGIFLLSTTALNVMHKPLHAAGLTIIQMLILCIPLALLGSYLFGLTGIFAAIALSYIVSGFISRIVLFRFFNIEIK
ncbi:MAG: MATE family efflux transporter [Candidatus Cloacimonetes bacterium]|jgi:putative MATE family efflux protein|nr:MATE family efflux transporter [Candidatus Cloacimonadota bacterium]